MGRKSKFRDDMRKIVGFVGYKADEVEQEPKTPIGAGRGIAWYSSSGAVASSGGTKGSDAPNLPAGVQDELESEAIGTSSSGRNSGGGGDVPQGDAPQVDSSTVDIANIGLSSGSVNQIVDLFDCTTGDAAVVSFSAEEPLFVGPTIEYNCVDVCVERDVVDPTYIEGTYWRITPSVGADFDAASINLVIALANTTSPYGWTYTRTTDGAGGEVRVIEDRGFDVIIIVQELPCGGSTSDFCNPTIDEIQPCLTTEPQCETSTWDNGENYREEIRGGIKPGWDQVDCFDVETGDCCENDETDITAEDCIGTVLIQAEQECPPVEVDPALNCLWPDTEPTQYSVNGDGTITTSDKDQNVPQEYQTESGALNLCNGAGEPIQILPGINGGHVIRNSTTGINYYRDPTTGKLSYFDNTQLNNYTAPTYP